MNTLIQSVHFVGICGTAMASAAAAMRAKGYVVTGSDQNVYPPMSDFLASSRIPVMSGYREENLDCKPDLVVIGNAISRGNPEAEAVLEKKVRYCSLPELLKDFFIRGKRSLVVTGTHGKTTTTALLTWVFLHNGLNPSYLIGGIPSNFSQGAAFTDSEWFIIEGDEYDTAFFDKRSKFVHYLPEVAIINNLEFDHADIFENVGAIQIAFKRFINLIPRNGLLLVNGEDANISPLCQIKHCPIKRFGMDLRNDIFAEQVSYPGNESQFLCDGFQFSIGLSGEFNVRNALAVIACARHCGLNDFQIQSAFSTFKGVKRRMEVRGEVKGITLVDDFGHHPTAIRETIKALRLRYPNRKIWAVFEPRSNTTRRNVFQKELAEGLSLADESIVSEVARLDQLNPSERLNPSQLIADIHTQGKKASYLPNIEEIVETVATNAKPGDVITIFSNGGFGGIHQKLLKKLHS